MKRILSFLLIVLMAVGVQAQQYYGRVSDKDGYTNIRRGPSTSYPIVSRYKSGDYLYYTPAENGWCKVYSGKSSNTFMGYMHKNHIVKVDPTGSQSSSNKTTFYYGRVSDKDGYTNIRRGPSTSSPIVGRYKSGDYLYYIPTQSGWYKVYSAKKSSSFMGYMHKSHIVNVNP